MPTVNKSSLDMLTPAWVPLRPHREQSALWRSPARFVHVVAGRGSGKTEIARRRIVRFLPVRKPWNDPIYFYALPTLKQAKRVAWFKLIELIPKDWLAGKPNISEMRVSLKFGSTLYVVGMDQPERIEGVQWDGGVIDESSDQKPGAFARSVLPALTHRFGWCWRIGAAKRYGIGAPEFRSEYDKGMAERLAKRLPNGEDSPDLVSASYNWPSEDILEHTHPGYCADARGRMTEKDYNEQFNAKWETAGGSIFYAFSEDEWPNGNVSKNACYNPGLPIFVGCDFNVSPMCWSLNHKVGNGLHTFDELVLYDTNTEDSLNFLYNKYGSHKAGIFFTGDAASRARKTASSTTDYLIIWNDQRWHDKEIAFGESNPPIIDRFNECNALLRNAKGERHWVVNPKCRFLINDFKLRSWKEGTREPDDDHSMPGTERGDLGHMSDAAGYLVHFLYPMQPFEEIQTVGSM